MKITFQRLIRLLAHPGKLKKQVGMLGRYLMFRARYNFLKKHRDVSPTSPKVLIVSFTETPFHVNTESLIGHALAREDAKPIVLTSKTNIWAKKYFEAGGITDFIYIEDYLRPHQDDGHEVRAFLSTHPTNKDLLAHTYRGIPIGRNALSHVLKTLRIGSIDPDDPHTIKAIMQALTSAQVAVRAAQEILETVSPSQLLFTEIGSTPQGELFSVAIQHGLHPIQYARSQRLDALTVKRYTSYEKMTDPVSLSRKSWELLQSMPWDMDKEEAFMQELESHYRNRTWFNFTASLDKKYKPPEEIRAQLKLDSNKKIAVIFSHVVWDASFYYGENLFEDYDHWLIETVKVACQNTQVQWIIKLHPDYIWHTKFAKGDAAMRDMVAILANVGDLPPHITIVPPDTDLDLFSFFGIADYCITVRGTVGLECPCFGISTFTAGTGRYEGLGFTEDSQTADEYLEKMRHIQKTPRLSPERVTLARKHAFGLFVLRPIVCQSFTLIPLYKNNRVVDHHLAIQARSTKEVENDPGLQAFAHWTLFSQEEDFLELPRK